MNRDSELDMFLAQDQHDDEMDGHVFADAVMAGVERRRVRRRSILALVGSLATAAAVTACAVLPFPMLSAVHLDLRSILALLVLAASIAVTWLRTEIH